MIGNSLQHQYKEANKLYNKYIMALERDIGRYLMLEAFPAVTEPPASLKLGLSFLSFPASNYNGTYEMGKGLNLNKNQYVSTETSTE